MKNIKRIIAFLNGYRGFASLNIVFNLFSTVFSLFSISMLLPFMQILFLDDTTKLRDAFDKGLPVFRLSADSLVDTINYALAAIVLTEGKMRAVEWICIFVVVSIFLKNFFRYAAIYYLAPIRNGVVKDLRNLVFGKTLELPLSYYSDERKGDIMSRMTSDVKEVEWSVMNSLEMIFRDPVTIFLFLGAMFLISVPLTLFVFVLLTLAGFIIGTLAKSLRKSSAKEKEQMGLIVSIIEETLGGLRIIFAFNAEKGVNKNFREVNEVYTRQMIKMYRKTDLASPLSEFLGVTVFAAVLYFGGKLVLGENPVMTGAVFLTYIAIFSQLIPPAKSFTTAYYNIQKGAVSLDRINKILDAEITIKDSENPQRITSFEKEIEYKNISFAYRKGDQGWVLQNINLKIPKGKTIALVGQSGSGKSTLSDLLPRFYDADSGDILIDGKNIRNIKINDLRALMGIVIQESILFNDTVMNNIALGMTNVHEQDVIAAAKIANAHDFIMQMPAGYQTNIGDRGSKMSGGQRQRISIARAVLKNPPILILDEATSALDTESERLVQEALNNLMKNRTSIVIAHRLSTIQHADEIIVLHKGEITERGNHAALLSLNGTYKKLYDMQLFV